MINDSLGGNLYIDIAWQKCLGSFSLKKEQKMATISQKCSMKFFASSNLPDLAVWTPIFNDSIRGNFHLQIVEKTRELLLIKKGTKKGGGANE